MGILPGRLLRMGRLNLPEIFHLEIIVALCTTVSQMFRSMKPIERSPFYMGFSTTTLHIGSIILRNILSGAQQSASNFLCGVHLIRRLRWEDKLRWKRLFVFQTKSKNR